MRMSDEELLAAVEAAEAMSLGPTTTEIATDRADALDRYAGKPYGDEQTGRSQVVSRDVSDVVEGVCANVLKPFIAGDDVVQFNPRGPEDEEQAEQETDYINFIVLERNNGFITLNSAIKDALLLRNGYVKCDWRVRQDVVMEMYQGLSEDELAALMQDKDIEVAEQNAYPDPYAMPQQPPAGAAPQPAAGGPPGAMPGPTNPYDNPALMPPSGPMLYDVKVRRTRPTEYCETMPCPPDETRVSHRHRSPSLQDADFFQHATHRTLSELREMGYKGIDDDLTDDDQHNTLEDSARSTFTTSQSLWDEPTQDPSRRIVLLRETWMRIDFDGDGIAELRKICQVGNTLLANEEADIIPFACGTPILTPHKHLGVSLYDQIKDLAQIKTVVTRGLLDNMYLSLNSEKVINTDAIDSLDDFMTSRPGGIKRVRGDPAGAVMPLVTPDTSGGALQALEYLDSVRENRTGYSKTAQGLDPDSLASDTATGMMAQLSQSQMRIEMIARTIAETLVRDLFRIVHAITLKHSSRAEKVRLRNKWVLVNPREWVRRTDLSISVGLGSGNGQQQLQNLLMLGQAQQQAMALGLCGPDEVFHTLSKMTSAMGYKNPELFFKPPTKQPKVDPQTGQPVIDPNTGQPVMESQPPPPQPSPQEKVAQINAQATMQQAMQNSQLEQQKMQAQQQFDGQKLQAEMQTKQQQIQMDAAAKDREQQNALALQASNDQRDAMRAQQEHERKVQEMSLQNQFKYDEMHAKFQFEAQQKELDRASQERMAVHNANTTMQTAQVQSQSEKASKQESKQHSLTVAQTIKQALMAPKRVIRDHTGRVSGVVAEDVNPTVQ
jgi:hypothetical protein